MAGLFIMKTIHLEKHLGTWLRRYLQTHLSTFVLFIAKLGWSALFGGLLLAAILLTKAF
jgi:hypothetical protein